MNERMSTEQPAPRSGQAEREIVVAVLNGDTEAFRELVRLHQQRVFALSLMMTRERQAAEEVTQDAFLNAYRHLHRYDVRRPFYPWLATIAARLAQTWLRRHARQRLALAPDMDALPAAHAPDEIAQPLKALIDDQEGRKLWAQVERLTAGERTAVMSYYRQQLSVAQIASQLGVTTGTVKTLLFRARRKLRERLSDTHATASREDTP